MSEKRLVVGGGCFWCIEAIFLKVKGVLSAVSAYTGGKRANPTYEQICTGVSGHAEVVDISYDSEIITLNELLDIFFTIHNPTTLNQQGADKGTQYRSVIYYDTNTEQEIILAKINELQKNYNEKIVTEISKLQIVYKAEGYHQNYYNLNKNQGYCQAVIAPKVEKFMQHFTDKLRPKREDC